MTTTLILHGTKLSGHAHRVELMLRMLGLPFEYVNATAEVRASEAFRRLNPLGQIPVLQDGELTLADSNAILVYLVRRYAPDSDWLPQDRAAALWNLPCDRERARTVAQRLLGFMEAHLGTRSWLAASHATIADLACYGYVKHAPEGGIDTAAYPALQAWLGRVETLPGFVPMPSSPLPS
jgi:glutathione S-transferase